MTTGWRPREPETKETVTLEREVMTLERTVVALPLVREAEFASFE